MLLKMAKIWGFYKQDNDRMVSIKAVPVTGSEMPRGFQEVKVPRLRDNGPEWW